MSPEVMQLGISKVKLLESLIAHVAPLYELEKNHPFLQTYGLVIPNSLPCPNTFLLGRICHLGHPISCLEWKECSLYIALNYECGFSTIQIMKAL